MLRSVLYKETVIEYDLRQTERKSIECRVEPGRVVVFAPIGMPVRQADAYILSQGDWVLQAKSRMRARAEAVLGRNELAMREGAPIPVEGRDYELVLSPGGSVSVHTEGEKIIVSGTDGHPLQVRAALRDYLTQLAMRRFDERVYFYSQKIGVRPKNITLREQKTKWGSCSSLGNLNFNWKLIMTPPGALDYVVVHELCHLIEMNHSPAFWAQVEKYKPDWKFWRDYLKDGIKSPFE